MWTVRVCCVQRNAQRFGGEAPRPASTVSPATPGLGPRASPHDHPPSAQRLAMTPAATAGDAALQAHHRRVAELAGAHGTHVQGGPSPGAYADASSPLTVGQLQSAGSGAQYALGSGAGSAGAATSDTRHHGGSTSALRVGGASASVHARTSALSATATATSASARRVRLRVDGDAGGDVLATPGFSGGSSLQPRGALFGTTHTSHEVTAQDEGGQAHGSGGGGGGVDDNHRRAHRHRHGPAHVHGHTHGHSNSHGHTHGHSNSHGSPGGASTGAATARSYHDFKRQAKAFRAWVAGVKAQQQVRVCVAAWLCACVSWRRAGQRLPASARVTLVTLVRVPPGGGRGTLAAPTPRYRRQLPQAAAPERRVPAVALARAGAARPRR